MFTKQRGKQIEQRERERERERALQVSDWAQLKAE